MYNIKTLNNISSKGLERLSSNLFAVDEEGAQPDGILVRSAAMQDMALPESLLGIARAGAGVNNIPVDKCSEAGIVVFNTPGANANAVKELVLGGLVLASRKVGKGMEWAKTLAGQGDAIGKLVEKGKSQFTGPELAGKTLGVVGLGAIGVKPIWPPIWAWRCWGTTRTSLWRVLGAFRAACATASICPTSSPSVTISRCTFPPRLKQKAL